MYRVLIVDDEEYIRVGIRSIIDWEAYGFRVIDEAKDGLEGRDKALELLPDLILADIRMPGLSGIELIEVLRKEGYKGKVIILTGYSDFEYARRAVSLNVSAYLLKPIEEEELCAFLESIKDQLDQEATIDEEMKEKRSLEVDRLLQQLLFMPKGTLRNEELREGLLYEEFEQQERYHVTLVEEVGESQLNEHPLYLWIKNYFHQQNHFVLLKENWVVIVFRNRSTRQIKGILKEMENTILKKEERVLFSSTGRQVSDVTEISQSYFDAKSLQERKFLYRDKNQVFWEDMDTDKKVKEEFIDSDYLYSMIEIGNQEAMEVYFSVLEGSFISSDISSDKIKGHCVKGILEVKEKLNYNYPELKNQFPLNDQILDQIYRFHQLSGIMEYMKTLFFEISSRICENSPESTMKRILNYIHMNYYKDLKLELLGKLFNYNSSYLGKLFKQETGKSFNRYLDEIRIEKAKELLESHDYKVYEISEKVGYRSVDYFYAKFKKIANTSPKAYKRLFSGEEDTEGEEE